MTRRFDRSGRPRPGFKVFHGVSELGLGARLAVTRRRLVLATLGVTGAFAAYSGLTASFMRSDSASVVVNLFLISGAMLFVLVAAYVQALLVGDLCFPGRWRERVILGERLGVSDDELPELAIGGLKDHSALFYLTVAVLLAVNYLLYGVFSGGFLSEYSTWGYQHTLLRSADPEAQIRGIRNVLTPLNEGAQQSDEVRLAIRELALGGSEEVRGWALWAIGELRIYEAAPELRELVASEGQPEEVRALAAESLGRLGDREGAELMAGLLAESFGRDALALGLLRGLGMARAPVAARSIERMTHVDRGEVRAHAFWALGRAGDRRYLERLVRLVEGGDSEGRCLAAEALKYLVERDDLVQAHTWFATVDETDCEGVSWERPYHWADERRFRQDIVVAETLEAKFLKIIFAAGGEREREFFATIARDAERPEALRALARELTLRIDHRQ